MRRLIEVASPHLQPILMLALGTGLRKGDILGLRWQDIDLDYDLITVFMQKTQRRHEIPILPMLREMLERMKREATSSEYVCTYKARGREAQPTKVRDIKTAFHAALKRAGLADKGFRFHDLRRTFATMLYNRGAGILRIRDLLGHKSVMTTERYLGVRLEEQRQAMIPLDSVLAKASTGLAQLPAESAEKPRFPLLLEGSK